MKSAGDFMEMLLTVAQAAERLQVTPYTVREHLKTGLLRGVKRGRLWRVPESALTEKAPASTVSQWEAAAERMAPIYEESLANDGELTLATTAPSEIYDYDD